VGSISQCIECTSEFCRIWTELCQEGALEEVLDQGETSRLLNTLEVRLCRGRHIDNIITEGSVEALPGGH
jgi:hypothetical protein